MSERSMDLLFELHHGLHRQGPGSRESTRKALDLIPGLPKRPSILDVGCGSGSQSLDLAELTGGVVTAVDIHQPFLDQLRTAAETRGLAERVVALKGDMSDLGGLGLPVSSFDLLWSEGALYSIGLERALRAVRPFLRPGGCLAFTELSWLTDQRPAEAVSFWNENYPELTDIGGNLERLESAGFGHLDHFTLPAEDWWRNYYTPLEAKLTAFERKHPGDPEAMQVASVTRKEVNLFRKFSEAYGYVFYVARVV